MANMQYPNDHYKAHHTTTVLIIQLYKKLSYRQQDVLSTIRQ